MCFLLNRSDAKCDMSLPDLGVDLGSRLEVDLNVRSQINSLSSTVKSVLSGTVCFL